MDREEFLSTIHNHAPITDLPARQVMATRGDSLLQVQCNPFQHVLANMSPPLACLVIQEGHIQHRTDLGMESDSKDPLEADTDGLNFEVVFQHLVSHLATPTGLLVPTKGQGRIKDTVTVDPDCARP